MSHIYIFSPSSAVRDKAGFRRAVRRLEAQGHAVEIDPDALASHQRFAGDDASRLAAIGRACASGADVAMLSRGGYGLTRLLAQIDYPLLDQAVQRGTQFVGHSDFTALSLAMLARTGTCSWAGPCLVSDFGTVEEPDDIMAACFDDLLCGQAEGTGWRLPRPRKAEPPGVEAHYKKARLWGGNLAVLCSLVGTPYLPKVKGGVLFLEDVGEHPYRIERLLTQLLHTGVLDAQQAIVLGQFTGHRPVPGHDRGFKMATVVDWLRSQIRTPVLTGLPHGHVATKVLLPVGRSVDLLVGEREALVVWG